MRKEQDISLILSWFEGVSSHDHTSPPIEPLPITVNQQEFDQLVTQLETITDEAEWPQLHINYLELKKDEIMVIAVGDAHWTAIQIRTFYKKTPEYLRNLRLRGKIVRYHVVPYSFDAPQLVTI